MTVLDLLRTKCFEIDVFILFNFGELTDDGNCFKSPRVCRRPIYFLFIRLYYDYYIFIFAQAAHLSTEISETNVARGKAAAQHLARAFEWQIRRPSARLAHQIWVIKIKIDH